MNADEYLQTIAAQIYQNTMTNDPSGGMTAARVGFLIRLITSDPPAAFGFPKLKDALLELEHRGVIRIGPNSKGALAVWPTRQTSQAVSPIASMALPHQGTSRRTRFLRSPVWNAFVSADSDGVRYIDRVSGEIRLGPIDDHDKDRWVPIVAMDSQLQRADSQAFLREEGRDNEPSLQAALESPLWYKELPEALNALDRGLVVKWKRRRTQWVVSRVEAWCAENHVPQAIVFQQAVATKRSDAPPPLKREADLKEHLIAALREMPTTELLKFRIPAKHLVAVLRPDLLAE